MVQDKSFACAIVAEQYDLGGLLFVQGMLMCAPVLMREEAGLGI